MVANYSYFPFVEYQGVSLQDPSIVLDVEYLLENNVYVNHRTNHGGGIRPLGLAIEHLYSDHPVVELLERYGANCNSVY
jgi:hypothetical protein